MAAVQIYSASAGSGKTFTLVKEYLKILFEKAHENKYHAFGNIMAITFTNKATEEMKHRVIDALKQISSGDETPILAAIREDLPDLENFDELAHRILIRLLRDFSNFNIQTIDSFFQDIIRSFARELKLPLNFEVELDRDNALEYAVDELISKIGVEKDLTKWLKEYAFTRIQDNKGWNFRQQLTKIGKELFDEELDLEALEKTASRIEEIKKRLTAIKVSFDNDVSAAGKAVLDAIDHGGIPREAYDSNFLGNLGKAAKAFKNIKISISPTYQRQLSNEQSPLKKGTLKKFGLEENSHESQAYLVSITHLHKILTEDLRVVIAAKEAKINIYALGVVHQLNDNLKKYRRDKNILFIIDAARLLAGFISLNDMPFLFEKIGSRIEYLFIDEFQDTSTAQWMNLLPLIKNILASSGVQNTIMLVGDAKQSIYRWRGGDYRLITGKAAESIQPFDSKTIHMDTNYRSLPEIVSFNNQFFKSVSQLVTNSGNPALQEELSSVYEHVAQSCARDTENSNKGKVSVQLIEKNEEDWKSGALDKLLDWVSNLTEAGYAYHDMAILVRKRDDGITISRHLQRAGIDVLSAETLLLKFDPDVKLVISALTFINEPDIPLNYVNLIWQYARRNKIQAIAESELFSDYTEKKYLDKWIPGLKEQVDTLAKLSSFQVFERICSALQMLNTDNLYLAHLRQILFDFFRRESAGLVEFLSWWKEKKDKSSIVLENGINKINVLTIHKAKGLEFPVVLIPFCSWEFYSMMSEDLLWLSDKALIENTQLPFRAVKALEQSIFEAEYKDEKKRKWMDSLNTLYVAFTRAEEVLYISIPVDKESKTFPNSASKLIANVLSGWETQPENKGLAYDSGELKTAAEVPEDSTHSEMIWHKNASDVTENLALRSKFENRETRIGNLVHNTLYYHRQLAENDLEDALFKGEQSGNYLPEEIDVARTHLERIIALPIFSQWIRNAVNIWNEQDIWYKNQLLRPDKILQLDDRFLIIDYKTGAHKSAYGKQVSMYMEAVAAIYPNSTVEGYILYTEDGLMEKVN